MAIEVVSSVITARRGPWAKADFMVLLMLANYADPDGRNIFPSVATLARACRLKERQVQASLKMLLNGGDEKHHKGVLNLKQPANKSGFGGRRTNEYFIDLEWLQKMQGCKICGGAICSDKGCKKQQGTGAENNRGPVQKTARHIDKTRHRPVNDLRQRAPRAPERRGASAVWEVLASKLSPELVTKLETWEAAPVIEGARLIIDFPRDYAERHVSSMRGHVERAAARPTVFRFAGREGEP